MDRTREVMDEVRGFSHSDLRDTPIGRDSSGNTWWNFSHLPGAAARIYISKRPKSDQKYKNQKKIKDASKKRQRDELNEKNKKLMLLQKPKKKRQKKISKKQIALSANSGKIIKFVDPNKPKRGKSAYLYFSKEQRSKSVAANPTAKNTEIMALVGIEWKKLSHEQKLPYQTQANIDKIRYNTAMETYVPLIDPNAELNASIRKMNKKSKAKAKSKTKSAAASCSSSSSSSVGDSNKDTSTTIPGETSSSSSSSSSSIGSKSASKNSKGGKKKRCGICDGCTAKECETCKYCLDKTKRGGSNTLRKPCLLRVCTNPIISEKIEKIENGENGENDGEGIKETDITTTGNNSLVSNIVSSSSSSSSSSTTSSSSSMEKVVVTAAAVVSPLMPPAMAAGSVVVPLQSIIAIHPTPAKETTVGTITETMVVVAPSHLTPSISSAPISVEQSVNQSTDQSILTAVPPASWPHNLSPPLQVSSLLPPSSLPTSPPLPTSTSPQVPLTNASIPDPIISAVVLPSVVPSVPSPAAVVSPKNTKASPKSIKKDKTIQKFDNYVGEQVARVWLGEDGVTFLGYIHGEIVEYLAPMDIDDIPLWKMKHQLRSNEIEQDYEDLEKNEMISAILLSEKLMKEKLQNLPVPSIALSMEKQIESGVGVYGFQQWQVLCHDLESLKVLHGKMNKSLKRRDMRMTAMLEEILINVEEDEKKIERKKLKALRDYEFANRGVRKSSRQMLIESQKAVAEEEEKKIMMERRIEQEEKRLQRSLDRRKLDNARKKIVGHADSMVTFEMPQELYALKNILGKIGDQTQDTTSISTSISSSSSSTSISSTSSSASTTRSTSTLFHRDPTLRAKALWFTAACVLRRVIHEDGHGWFHRPVTKLVAPDYNLKISQPMDLATVFCKLLLKKYNGSYSDFVFDVKLIWKNAIAYNGSDTPVGEAAARLDGIFDEGWNTLIGGQGEGEDNKDTDVVMGDGSGEKTEISTILTKQKSSDSVITGMASNAVASTTTYVTTTTVNTSGVVLKCAGVPVTPEELQRSVNYNGGVQSIRDNHKWQLVRVDLNIPPMTSSGSQLNKIYTRYFETDGQPQRLIALGINGCVYFKQGKRYIYMFEYSVFLFLVFFILSFFCFSLFLVFV